jgi:hypothetical protein
MHRAHAISTACFAQYAAEQALVLGPLQGASPVIGGHFQLEDCFQGSISIFPSGNYTGNAVQSSDQLDMSSL